MEDGPRTMNGRSLIPVSHRSAGRRSATDRGGGFDIDNQRIRAHRTSLGAHSGACSGNEKLRRWQFRAGVAHAELNILSSSSPEGRNCVLEGLPDVPSCLRRMIRRRVGTMPAALVSNAHLPWCAIKPLEERNRDEKISSVGRIDIVAARRRRRVPLAGRGLFCASTKPASAIRTDAAKSCSILLIRARGAARTAAPGRSR